MTFESGFPRRLTAIDDLTLGDHSLLLPGDVCHFLGEYTARKGFAYSATNRLILDFKTSMSYVTREALIFKLAAIDTAAAVLRGAIHPNVLDQLVFVPMPPSKARGEVGYDDRLVRMLRAVRPGRPLDVRELLVQTRTVEPSHRRSARPHVSEIAALYRIDEALAVVDDLLTSGAHFRAAKLVLTRRFPDTEVVGLFLARRVPDTTAPEAEG